MTGPRPSTCATCRHIGYTRVPGEQPSGLTCANTELAQRHTRPSYNPDTGTFGDDIPEINSFIPPNLAFGCDRWAERAPDIGMVPVRLGGPPAWRSVPYQPTDVRRGTFVVFDPVTTGPKPC
ncbi:hypothetical protein ACMT4L_17050 [Deinococcus sp. A31D244]|uniref:hypothetical protein n=1 Tax=Deinococcus sp. A31D244 TaxID=3397675 RepID=UPI0039E045E4